MSTAPHNWRKPASAVTWQALRIRAAKIVPKSQRKHCAYCGEKNPRTLDHVDGNERNTTPANLVAACQSCNGIKGHFFKRLGIGKRVDAFNRDRNPSRPVRGASTWRQWVMAVNAMKYGSADMTPRQAIEMVHATPPAARSRFARQIWEERRRRGTDTWGTSFKFENPTMKNKARKAFALGQAAHKAGKKRIPGHDAAMNEMHAGRAVGDPRTKAELKAWLSGWDTEQLRKNPRGRGMAVSLIAPVQCKDGSWVTLAQDPKAGTYGVTVRTSGQHSSTFKAAGDIQAAKKLRAKEIKAHGGAVKTNPRKRKKNSARTPGLQTIAGNRTALINHIFNSASNPQVYSLANGFSAKPTTLEQIRKELSQSKRTKLVYDGAGRYSVKVHSNLWYTFISEPPAGAKENPRRCPNCGGSGASLEQCRVCNGTGKVTTTYVRIPNARRKRAANPSILEAIKPGDCVTILTPHGQQRSGRAVMRGPMGWVLNMGGANGTPGIADEDNIVRVTRRNSGDGNGTLAGAIKDARAAVKVFKEPMNIHKAAWGYTYLRDSYRGEQKKQWPLIARVTKTGRLIRKAVKQPRRRNSLHAAAGKALLAKGNAALSMAGTRAARGKSKRRRNAAGHIQEIGPGQYQVDSGRGTQLRLVKKPWGWEVYSDNKATRAWGRGREFMGIRTYNNLAEVEKHYKALRGISRLFEEPGARKNPARRPNGINQPIPKRLSQKALRELDEDVQWLQGKLADPNGKQDSRAPQWRQELREKSAALRAALKANPARRRNSAASAGAAAATYEMFHGKPSTKLTEYVQQIRAHKDYAQLGNLVKLCVKAPGGKFEIEFTQQDQVLLCCDPGRRQLYIIGGNQQMPESVLRQEGLDTSKDMLDLGELTHVEYHTRKRFDDFKPITYFHKLGEETGERPRLMYDKLNKQLHLVGGAYQIKPEGIVN